MKNANFNYIMSTLLELWGHLYRCTTTCTCGPSLEYDHLFHIVSVICSPNIMTCNEKRDTSIVMNVYESSI